LSRLKKIDLLLIILTIFFWVNCQKIESPTESQTNSATSDEITDENISSHEDSTDYVWNDSLVKQISLNSNSISIDSPWATISGSKITITSSGTYRISGTLTDGQIVVNTDDKEKEIVRIILAGVNISNSTNSPIYIMNSPKTLIVLEENTNNVLSDASSFTYENTEYEEPNAAIFSKDNLSFFGSGSLTINANFNDGISSKDGLIIKSGNINVNSKDDGIRGKDYLIVEGGTITINSGGDALKSDNETDATCGYILISNGTLNLISGGDAIDAQTNVLIIDGNFTIKSGDGSSFTSTIVSSKGIKGLLNLIIDGGTFSINSADDGLHSNGNVTINGGIISISSGDDGIHADNKVTINNGTINITKSVEGIESHYIYVNDGEIRVVSSDDSFNSTAGSRTERDDNSCTYIHGGYIVLIPSSGDGLDSNGDMEMTAGTVIIHGPSNQPEVMIDYNGTFNVTGGFLTSSGSSSNMTQAPSSTSSQCAIKVMFNSAISASTIFHIEDSNGNSILTFQPSHRYQSIVFSSSDLQKGKTYSIFKGGSSTGTSSDGLYKGGTYSGGTLYKNFTISNTITNLN
jgi:hypothetical protein